ncbi:helix-turn-helix transcriptional regulator [Actinomycetaceae bacterium L2_0104]
MWEERQAKDLGIVLRKLRQDRGLTQEHLAYAAGITKNQVQLIEAGRGSGRKDIDHPSNPRLSTLAGIANALDVSVSDVLKRANI